MLVLSEGMFPGVKSNFVTKGIPIGTEMAEKNAYTHTNIFVFI